MESISTLASPSKRASLPTRRTNPFQFRSLARPLIRIFTALIGPGLLAYLVFLANPALIWRQAHSVGWGLLLIIILGALPQLVRTWAWRQAFMCDISALSWSRSLGSQLASDAIGQLGVTGKLVGETVRVSLLDSVVPVANGISACAIDAGMHAFTAVIIAVAGIAASLSIAPVSGRWRFYAVVFAAALISVVISAAVSMANRWPLMGKLARKIGRLPKLNNWIAPKMPVIDSAERNLLTFRHEAPGSFWASFALNLLWHLLAVLEVYLILRFMGLGIAALGALALEGLTKLINIIGSINPGNVGTYEGGNMMIAKLFGVASTAGLTLALCRRARAVFWGGIGALCLLAMKRRAEIPGASVEAL